MSFLHRSTSLFLPYVTRVPMKDLLRSPRWNAWKIMFALLGDVVVASSAPLGTLIALSVAGVLSPWAAVAVVNIFLATITILKLGALSRVYEGHLTVLLGGSLYIFKDGHGELAVTSQSAMARQWTARGPVFYVELPGLASWIQPTMVELTGRSAPVPLRLNAITARTHALSV